ncbi:MULTISPECIES: MFS transporter [Mycobacterium]|uniref:Permease n=1 Tax=Mycobacterium kiyosense TaxID=2871094 RepID=A0AA37PSB0_9MYCO|nr:MULTISPECIES: MFS transporter [Mycobacterium]BDB39748.1 permease [Mycobacterium kiyosense]BDE11603.1 permease [Mycobacterium sp. 20KCMC460]GLB81881.1 permease [Mycobacterium kiyosense]GLB88159.1 permease [Mycobacterium kiyosense]GLB95719.1 permease [Mycobacterium kiyosense]
MKSNGVCTDAPPLRSAPEGEQPRQSRGKPEVFAGVLAILLATGWAANHFAALIPAISDAQHLSASLLDAIFGIYAVGLLPGLLLGGRASDAFGRPSIALTGAATVLAGTIPMLLSQQSDVLLAGRLVVGVGVGLAMSSCTAWASDLNGPPGAAVAGAVLIAGFAVGPFVSGVITAVCPSAIGVSFATAAGLVGTAIVVVALALRRSASPGPVRGRPAGPGEGQSTGLALSWAMPLAPWVFASATLAFVTIPTRIHTGLAATMVAGIAALITNGVSGISQLVARGRRWGPQAGTAGALLAALGYATLAAAPPNIPVALGLSLLVLLGCASGLCLREGLIDLEAAAPQHNRGALTGAFYAVTYIGFGLPLLLTEIGLSAASAVLAVLAVLATVVAAGRALRLRRNQHRQS